MWPSLTSPYAKIENGARSWPSHRASAAAIFIGCWRNITLASVSPLTAVSSPAMTTVTSPSRSEVRITGMCFLRARWKAAMPTMKAPPTRNAAVMVWKNWVTAVSWVSTRQKSVRLGAAAPR